MCLQNQRLSLFPLLVHGSVGTGNECSVNISLSISLKYLVGTGRFPGGGGGVLPYFPYINHRGMCRPKGRVFAQGWGGRGLIRISSDKDDQRGQKSKLKKIQTLTTKDCKGPQTNMPENVGSIKT